MAGKDKSLDGWPWRWRWRWLLTALSVPVATVFYLYQADGFDPAVLPEYRATSLLVPESNNRVLGAIERVGEGLLAGPEDLAYDAESCILYTGCEDGWIKKISLCGEPAVHNWSFAGGRPLGLAFGPDKKLIVADAYMGLLRVSKDGEIEVLAKEAKGLTFGLTDGVDVSNNGVIYFTDASYKYDLQHHMLDIVEGRPHGRLLRYDPLTKLTSVLLDGLYFPNGVALSPTQDFLVYCETVLARCRKYHIEGEKKGYVENFIEDLPGFPDNIRYDGDGRFWIALATGKTFFWNYLMENPWLRKTMVILSRFTELPEFQKKGGALAVSLEGNPLALYSDHGLHKVTGAVKIGNHLYLGSLDKSYIMRLDLIKHAANAT